MEHNEIDRMESVIHTSHLRQLSVKIEIHIILPIVGKSEPLDSFVCFTIRRLGLGRKIEFWLITEKLLGRGAMFMTVCTDSIMRRGAQKTSVSTRAGKEVAFQDMHN